MFTAINETRQELGIPAVVLDRRLVGIARARSEDMVTNGYFAHQNGDNVGVFELLDLFEIPSPYAGEILARTNGKASDVIPAFLSSPTHKRVLLRQQYTRVGIGEAVNIDGLRYIAIVFIGD